MSNKIYFKFSKSYNNFFVQQERSLQVLWFGGQISLFPGRGETAPSLAPGVMPCFLSLCWASSPQEWPGRASGEAAWWECAFGCPEVGLLSQHVAVSGVSGVPGLTQSTEAPCCVTLLCKQGTGGCQGFSTQTMLCHAPCISPPAAWRGSVPRTSHPPSWGAAGTDSRALSQAGLLVEGLSLGWEQLALVSDSCSCV